MLEKLKILGVLLLCAALVVVIVGPVGGSSTGIADNVEIQAAIDALPPLGGTVELPARDLYFSDTIAWTKDGVRLLGQGTATRVHLMNGVNASVFKFGDGTAPWKGNATFENFLIDANMANQTAGHGIYLQGVFNVHIQRMLFQNCKGNCIFATGSVYANTALVSITDSYFAGSGQEAIYFLNNAYGALISGNNISGTGAGYAGVAFTSNGDHTVVGNLFDDGSFGLRVYSASGIVATGNQFLNINRTAIQIDGESHSVTISGNLIINPSDEGISWAGIALDASYVTVVGNSILGNTNQMAYGIRLVGTSNRNLIQGNVIKNTVWGIREEGTADHNVIIDNLIQVTTTAVNTVGTNTVVR